MATLAELVTALSGTNYPFAHHAWASAPNGTYGVYAEESSHGFYADSKMQGQAITCTVDVFTKDDSETIRSTVQTALNTLDMPWYLDAIDFEEDTGYIHYTWVVDLYG